MVAMEPEDFSRAYAQVAAARTLGYKSRYDAANRAWLLAVHVMFGLGFGFSFLIWGVPISWKLGLGFTGTYVPSYVPVIPILGATLLGIGLLANRNKIMEALGMAIMMAWEIAGACAVVHWINTPTKMGGPPGPVQYQLAFYVGMALLMLVHLVTLIAYLRTEET